MQRGSIFVKEHVLANMSFLSYAHVSRCAHHELEPTGHVLIYTDDVMTCSVSPHSVVAICSAWFNAPSFFLWGQQRKWIGQGGPVAWPCWPIVAATISNMKWGTGPTPSQKIILSALLIQLLACLLTHGFPYQMKRPNHSDLYEHPYMPTILYLFIGNYFSSFFFNSK